MKNKHKKIVFLIILILILFIFLSLTLDISYKFDTIRRIMGGDSNPNDLIKIKLRLMRLISAFVIGSILSVSGLIFQGLTRNPLSEPYILGTSSGAGLGLCVGIYVGIVKVMGYAGLMVFGFLGAGASVILVLTLSRVKGKIDPVRLILSGVIIGTIASSLMVFLLTLSKSTEFHGILGWFLGDLDIANPHIVLTLLIITILSMIMIYPTIKYLDAISLSDASAYTMGVDVRFYRVFYFILTSILVSISVSVSGIIGFVGLVIPHIFRLTVDVRHKVLFPYMILGGGTFLIICDFFSRFLIPGTVIPVGLITALVGGPFFIIILRKRL